jgi:hypothetical protein
VRHAQLRSQANVLGPVLVVLLRDQRLQRSDLLAQGRQLRLQPPPCSAAAEQH